MSRCFENSVWNNNSISFSGSLLHSYLCRFNWGGSNIRPEATGYGVVYFVKNILDHAGDTLEVNKT